MELDNPKTFSFTEWLRTNIGGQNYDYLMLSGGNGDLYFVLKNKSESRLIKVSKKMQKGNSNEDIAVLIRNGEELKQPHNIALGQDHKIVFEEEGKITLI